MRRFYLLGVFLAVILAGCTDPRVSGDMMRTREYNDHVESVRQAQAKLEVYIRTITDSCLRLNKVLVRDNDGILLCIVPPVEKKTEENK